MTRHAPVIDFHNHLGIDLGADLAQTAAELLERMDEADIARAVVFPFLGCPDLADGNADTLRAASASPERLIPFVGLNARGLDGGDDAALRSTLRECGARGVAIEPRVHDYALTHPGVAQIMRACVALEIPILVHFVGHGSDSCWPVVSLAARYPSVAVIASPLVHCTDWRAVASRRENLYADTARALSPRHIRNLVDVLGATRVLFGSDTPSMAPMVERAKLRFSDLGAASDAGVLSDNASRLLS